MIHDLAVQADSFLPSRRALRAVAIASVLAVAALGRAEAVTLTAVDAGFVTVAGGSAKGDGTVAPGATYNYSVGYEVHYPGGFLSSPPFAPMDRNNYFVFDSTGLGGVLVGAALELYTGMFESVDASETFDVVAPTDPGAALADADALLVGNLTGGVPAFDDAGDPLIGVAAALYGNIEGGPMTLGSAVVSTADDDSILSIPIDVGYVSAFLGGPIFLGGTVSSIAPGDGTPQQPFGFTGPDIPGGDPLTPTLVLTFAAAPEPSTLVLGVLALAAAAAASRRRAARPSA